MFRPVLISFSVVSVRNFTYGSKIEEVIVGWVVILVDRWLYLWVFYYVSGIIRLF